MTGTKIVKLKLEEGSGEKLPELKENVVDAALRVWQETPYQGVYEYTERILSKTEGLNVNSKQLQEIISRLEEDYSDGRKYDEEAGLFLTALMRNSGNFRFRIKTEVPLSYVGYLLDEDKTITVNGNVGDNLGEEMENGRIIVNGHARTKAGDGMRGGKIEIKGSAGNAAAHCMRGGELHVQGGTGKATALNMTGGTLKVKGKIEEISANYDKGTIYEGETKVRPKPGK
ncbi:MAG: hypothetical protein V1921_06550 [Candidatus Altiarchaeota archaeon]